MKQPFCAGPFTQTFVLPNGDFRECCNTDPQIVSSASWPSWWTKDQRLIDFRNQLKQDQWPAACVACKKEEESTGKSFRTALNKDFTIAEYPSRWAVMAGNTCNLACWSCHEEFSSKIEDDKRKLGILPIEFINPRSQFKDKWPELKQHILDSYLHHEIVTLNFMGGEPTYNKTIAEFLKYLVDNNLSNRTKLELITNGTGAPALFDKRYWHSTYIAISVDAIGKKSEWIRYGSKWDEVAANIKFYNENSSYTELHCTLSILNILAYPELKQYANNTGIKLVTNLLQQPRFMSIMSWDKPVELDMKQFEELGLTVYSDLLGSNPNNGSSIALQKRIEQLGKNRMSLDDYYPELAELIYR